MSFSWAGFRLGSTGRLVVLCALLLALASCSKADRPRPSPTPSSSAAELEALKKALLDNMAQTCEGAAMAVVWSTSEGKASKDGCSSWRVHGDPPPNTPTEVSKSSVLVWCESPRAYYAVRLATGEVLSLREPAKPVHLDAAGELAASASKACAHVYD